ncbi:hypothetical protein [Sphingobium sp. B8D3A]|uniref:hypothetical protein n=1 Tax=Sphingobium sp. B8D3A TaxID=2940584 RepID=UPI0022258E08|nr:hypothetical protein [Sphingobium sp. B8D3A]MCW2413045.1 hypothetical protein [Sphingobium sp. B8D3D]
MAIGSVRLNNLAPSTELERALQTPTFEPLHQKADDAIFECRVLAVDKEHTNKVEMAKREKQQIAEEAENARDRATGHGEAEQVGCGSGSQSHPHGRKRRDGAEQAHIAVCRNLPAGVLMDWRHASCPGTSTQSTPRHSGRRHARVRHEAGSSD